MRLNLIKRIFILLLVAALLPACGRETPAITESQATTAAPTTRVPPTPVPPSATPLPPTPTPVPLAVRIDGEGLPLSDYLAELERYAASKGKTGTELATEEKQRVLDELIDQVLLAQGAADAGFSLEPAALQERLAAITVEAGGEAALEQWMEANHYTRDEFQVALSRSIAAAWMRDQIAAQVSETADQVHVQQILLYDEQQANGIYSRLQNGADFDTLAWEVDPVSGGEMGWFPQGTLLEPDLENAAFSLQPGSYSPIIATRLGYHIVRVLERQASRPLDPAARLALQTQAVSQWLDQRQQQSSIEITTP